MAVHYDFYKSPPASDKEGKVRLHPRVLASYFASNRFISRQEFQTLCGLRQTAAIQRLKHLTAMGLLNKVGSPHFPMYEPVNKE